MWSTWARTHVVRPLALHKPTTVAEVQGILKSALKAHHRVRAVGSGHSPNDCAVTGYHMVDMSQMRGVVAIDRERGLVTALAGTTLHELNSHLLEHGLNLATLGSISDQQLGGAIATGTHGSGIRHGSLSAAVQALQLVTPGGEVIAVDAQSTPDLFSAARVSLGALGVVTEVTLKVESAFQLRERTLLLQLDDVLAQVDKWALDSEHFKFLWYPHTDVCVVYDQSRTVAVSSPPPSSSWLRDRLVGYHLLESLLFLSKSAPSLVPFINRAYARALSGSHPHERVGPSASIFNFDCLFKQRVAEWALPASECAWGMRTLRDLIDRGGFKAQFPVEVRFTARDDIWLSNCYGRDTCYIGVIAYRPYGFDTQYEHFFYAVQNAFAEKDARPHWAKWFSMPQHKLATLYPHFERFCKVRRELDPHDLMVNDFIRRTVL